MDDFMECDDCQSKTGSPVLCGGCLVNRGLISQLKTENEELREENKALRENWENLREWMKGKKINFSGDDRFWRGYEDFYYDVKAKLKELEGGEIIRC